MTSTAKAAFFLLAVASAVDDHRTLIQATYEPIALRNLPNFSRIDEIATALSRVQHFCYGNLFSTDIHDTIKTVYEMMSTPIVSVAVVTSVHFWLSEGSSIDTVYSASLVPHLMLLLKEAALQHPLQCQRVLDALIGCFEHAGDSNHPVRTSMDEVYSLCRWKCATLW